MSMPGGEGSAPLRYRIPFSIAASTLLGIELGGGLRRQEHRHQGRSHDYFLGSQ